MTDKGAGNPQSRASHAVLIEVLNVLGRYVDHLVVIGGWVPELLYPDRGHLGSLDVDLAVDGRHVRPDAYGSIRKRLVDAGFKQSGAHAGVFTRGPLERMAAVIVKLDLVSGEQSGRNPDAAGGEPQTRVQDLILGQLRGVELAFEDPEEMVLSGVMPDGADNAVRARVVSVPAFLCLKAFALSERKKEKDAYDIHFCLRHCEGGPAALARAARPLLDRPRAREAMDILRQKFATVTSVGPQWAAAVAAGQGGADSDAVARDAFERAALFFATLDLDGQGGTA